MDKAGPRIVNPATREECASAYWESKNKRLHKKTWNFDPSKPQDEEYISYSSAKILDYYPLEKNGYL